MLKTYNKENNTYSRYFHVSEIEAALEKMKQISSRVEYRPFDEIPNRNQIEDYHLTIDDANSLEKMFADNPAFKLEHPINGAFMPVLPASVHVRTKWKSRPL